ncbi:MAG TPA: hypothetical protein VLG16_03390 [Candidatus Saccharimonadales bacterium]|nr:hypothetical protein [Candidatus Saccharimonadales bacterium]
MPRQNLEGIVGVVILAYDVINEKRTLIGLAASGILLLGVIGGANNAQTQNSNTPKNAAAASSPTIKATTAPKAKPICDGTSVTADCTVGGVNYSTYVYHPAIAEKSHTETVTTYQKQVTGHCTLCNDGTYSPSCATGRGACSYHGGVQEWNAPEYTNSPTYSTNTIIDAPAQAAYYDKVAE